MGHQWPKLYRHFERWPQVAGHRCWDTKQRGRQYRSERGRYNCFLAVFRKRAAKLWWQHKKRNIIRKIPLWDRTTYVVSNCLRMPRSPRTAKQPGHLGQPQIKSTCIHPNLDCWDDPELAWGDPLLSQGHPVMSCDVLGWSSVVLGSFSVILRWSSVVSGSFSVILRWSFGCPRVTLWCPGVVLCCLGGHSQLSWGDPLLSWGDPLLSWGSFSVVLGSFSVVLGSFSVVLGLSSVVLGLSCDALGFNQKSYCAHVFQIFLI